MNDIGVDYIKKMFNKTTVGKKIKASNDPVYAEALELQEEVNFEEQVLENKIKLRTMKSITDDMIDKTFKDSNLDKYIMSIIQVKIAENIKGQAHFIVREALEDLEDSYDLTSSIRTQVVSILKNSLKGRQL